MKKAIIFFILFVIIVCTICFFKSQTITEGYVFGAGDKEIWIIESSSNTDTNKMKANEISETFRSKGTFYSIPITNRILNTKFKVGQKVRIFWSGEVLQSLPGKVEHTSLIIIEKGK